MARNKAKSSGAQRRKFQKASRKIMESETNTGPVEASHQGLAMSNAGQMGSTLTTSATVAGEATGSASIDVHPSQSQSQSKNANAIRKKKNNRSKNKKSKAKAAKPEPGETEAAKGNVAQENSSNKRKREDEPTATAPSEPSIQTGETGQTGESGQAGENEQAGEKPLSAFDAKGYWKYSARYDHLFISPFQNWEQERYTIRRRPVQE